MSPSVLETPHERKILNEGIEKCFLDCAGYAGIIRVHYQTGNGLIRDIYENFFHNLAMLFELTADLENMSSSTAACNDLEQWLSLPPVKDRDMKERCDLGLKVFRAYKIALTKNGIVSLPS